MTSGMTKKNKHFILALLASLWLLLAYNSGYAGPVTDSSLEAVLLNLSKIKHSKARFVETKFISILDNKIKLTGTLEYITPDTLIKKTITPQPEFFKVSGDKLHIVKADGEQYDLLLSNYPVIAVFTEAYRGVLGGNLRTLNDYYDVSFKTSENNWTITLLPLDEEALEYIEAIELSGSDTHIRTVTTTEPGGDKSIMQINADKQVF